MSEIIVNHFSKVDEPDLRFDGKYYTVKGDSRYEKEDVYENLTEEEIQRGHHINYHRLPIERKAEA